MSAINLTKFRITPELQSFGVEDLSVWKEFQEVRNLLYFPEPPTAELVRQRVERLGEIAIAECKRAGTDKVLVSCPPWVAHALFSELVYHGLKPVVSYTKKTQEHGITVVGLVEAA
ncbi:hypothetical protein ACS8E9_18710 [Pseudomonas neustonica]|uniref:hypothetical protein n=1 Tax=Pseudomonas neustonica TaxID=2487346 RepID=UPI003F4713A6|tara:strand:- start:11110 stop:11457 length:348 start_codon:yes stop_codon:yes gene_type:complete